MSDIPRIGMRLHGGMDPQRCIELAKAAEANNFSSLWFAENPMERGVLPVITACALATQRIPIGVGVWNPYNRHPSLIAMEIAALDELIEGRARLGIGSSRGDAIKRLGIDFSKPVGALRDTFHIVRALLRGETVTYKGSVFAVDGLKLGFKPRRPDMPLFMAARGAQSLGLCGQVADGLMVSNMCAPGFTAHAVELVKDGAMKAGRAAPANIFHYVLCVPQPDRDSARRTLKIALAGTLKNYWGLALQVPAAMEGIVRYSGIPEADFQATVDRLQAGTPPETAIDQRFVGAFAIAGTAEECREQIAIYARAGVTELVLTFVGADPIGDMSYLSRALRLT